MTKTNNIKILRFPFFILTLFCLVYYIFQVGALSQELYLIEDYENRLVMLLEKNKFLDINFSKMSSLSNIENYLMSRNFVKPSQVKYIQILESSVVSKPR